MLRKDVTWQCPAEFKANLDKNLDITDIIVLTKGKESEYDTILVFRGENGELYADSVLSQFTCSVFNPFHYELIAVVDYKLSEATDEPG